MEIQGLKKRIRPLTDKCKCGKKVTDHHFKCNECWGKTEKAKHHKKMKKLMEPTRRRLNER